MKAVKRILFIIIVILASVLVGLIARNYTINMLNSDTDTINTEETVVMQNESETSSQKGAVE